MAKAALNAIPSGTITPFGGDVLPNGYLHCNGNILNRADFPQLFAAIGTIYGHGNNDGLTFHLPDTRGLFLRGVDGTKGNDPDKLTRTAGNAGGNSGNNVGSVQLDDTKPHTHATGYAMWLNDSGSFHGPGGYAGHIYRTSDGVGGPHGNNNGNITAQNNTGTETRPKNMNTNYIIKI